MLKGRLETARHPIPGLRLQSLLKAIAPLGCTPDHSHIYEQFNDQQRQRQG
ncbi:MAG: hypothetical protein ACYTXY_04575 [Nostoc sp.]